MFTYMTRFGLWRTAVDLHPSELKESIHSAREILAFLLDQEAVIVPPSDADEFANVANAWTEYEHALANYGAVLCHRWHILASGQVHPDIMWFANQQREIRAAGWPYSRPEWATNVEVLTGHRQKLVNLRPSWYGPKFDMKPMEVLA